MNPQVADFLRAYEGDNDFLMSVKLQFEMKGFLSEKQIAAVQKWTSPQPRVFKEFSIKPAQIIRISGGFARGLVEKGSIERPVFSLEVVSVERETEKAWLLKLKGSSAATGYCACCGLTLTDPVSIQSNVGPTCAENWGIPYGKDPSITKAELAKKLERAFTTEALWIPKSVVKEIL